MVGSRTTPRPPQRPRRQGELYRAALWSAAAAALAIGCDPAARHPVGESADVFPRRAGAGGECAADSDCIAASTSCCQCPTFALPRQSGWQEACEDVCAPPQAGVCPATRPVCSAGRCRLACAPIACPLRCSNGFAADAAGCLSCTCAPDTALAKQCQLDADCVRAPADCCGCERGGTDIALPRTHTGPHAGPLDCPEAPSCPGRNLCNFELVPRCVAGGCTLLSQFGAGAGGERLCGTPELPACFAAEVCLLNAPGAEASAAIALGVCRPE